MPRITVIPEVLHRFHGMMFFFLIAFFFVTMFFSFSQICLDWLSLVASDEIACTANTFAERAKTREVLHV